MLKQFFAICACVGITLVSAASEPHETVAPGARMQVLAHNAYPDHGKYADRLDRALAAGVPFAVEQDLAWVDSRSLMIHGKKNVAGDDPTLDTYFFPKVRPLMEKALKKGNGELAPDYPVPGHQERSAGAPGSHFESAGPIPGLAHHRRQDGRHRPPISARPEADDGAGGGQAERHQAAVLL